jgi:phosphoglycerate dehydrogenase-like enzyme
MLRRIGEAEAVCVGAWDLELLRAARSLRWVHAFSGGVNGILFPEFAASRVPLTCFKGCFDVPAAEHALAMMLAYVRRLEYDIRMRPQKSYDWQEPTELRGKTAGIIGLGSMGRAIARACRSFGMRVLAATRRPQTVDPALATATTLPELLAAADFVIVAVPLTRETTGLIGATQLRAMKPDAYLIDISGRPAIYDLAALERALREQRIAGANLQMAPEPASPLWELDNLLLTFHRVTSREQYDRCVATYCDNLRRYRAGEPLLGLVDKVAGY